MHDLPMSSRFIITHAGARALVQVEGELDVATAPALRHHLAVVIDAGAGDVLVDMSGVTFCDSTALCVLVAARLDLAAAGRRMRVVEPSRWVRHLLSIAELPQLLT